jgi:hypothetical protein
MKTLMVLLALTSISFQANAGWKDKLKKKLEETLEVVSDDKSECSDDVNVKDCLTNDKTIDKDKAYEFYEGYSKVELKKRMTVNKCLDKAIEQAENNALDYCERETNYKCELVRDGTAQEIEISYVKRGKIKHKPGCAGSAKAATEEHN